MKAFMKEKAWPVLKPVLLVLAGLLALAIVPALLLALCALLIPLLSVPLRVRVEYYDSVALQLRWLFVRYQLVPAKEKKPKKKKAKKEKPKEEKPKEEKPKEEKEKKPNIFARFYEYQGIPGFLELLRRTMAAMKKFGRGLWRCFCIRQLHFAMTLTGGDPEALAYQYGKMSAAIFPALGFLCTQLRTRKGNIKANIYPDFTGLASKRMECLAEVSVVPVVLIGAILALAIRLGMKVVLKFIKGAKEPKEETQAY